MIVRENKTRFTFPKHLFALDQQN